MNPTPAVLVVDDDLTALELLAASLRHDLQLTRAPGGHEALAVAARQGFDLVVLDVDMPGLDGYDTCRALRQLPGMADVPVMFCSAHTGIDERLKGYGAGGDDYLCKPVVAAELRAKIDQALARRQRHHQLARDLDEMTHVALSTADMAGEAGVVLEFQRQLSACTDRTEVARQLLQALSRFELEACVRIHDTPEPVLRNSRGEATALEASILDHLLARPGSHSVVGVGPHTGFRQTDLVLFVRQLPVDRPADMDRTVSERIGRHVDSVSLLVQGAAAHLMALQARAAMQALTGSRQLVDLTREALVDLSALGQAQRLQARSIFRKLAESVENSYLSLGLTHDQEDMLSSIIRRHSDEVLQALDSGQEFESRLADVIRLLTGQAAAPGAPPRTAPLAPT